MWLPACWRCGRSTCSDTWYLGNFFFFLLAMYLLSEYFYEMWCHSQHNSLLCLLAAASSTNSMRSNHLRKQLACGGGTDLKRVGGRLLLCRVVGGREGNRFCAFFLKFSFFTFHFFYFFDSKMCQKLKKWTSKNDTYKSQTQSGAELEPFFGLLPNGESRNFFKWAKMFVLKFYVA
jgi:hypothetical protein